MPREIEAKLRVESHEPVRQRLQSVGAAPLGRVVETNVILDHADGSLRRRGCGLRVRTCVADGTGESTSTLTVKGPVEAGPFKSREELEIQISDPSTAMRILELLGFVSILSYRKRRESWRLDECRVELDEPPHVGLFVEIEGPDEASVHQARRKLGLAEVAHVKASYVGMLMAYCDERRIADRVLDLPGSAGP